MQKACYTVQGFPERLNELIYIKNDLNAGLVADAVGVNRKTMYSYLHGDTTPNLVIFNRMCSFLRTTPEYLISGK